MGIQLSDCVENIVEKQEIAHYEQFSFSHNVLKSCLMVMHQNEYLWSKGTIRISNLFLLNVEIVPSLSDIFYNLIPFVFHPITDKSDQSS